MLYIVYTTGKCNLKCIYCGGSFPQDLVPWEVQYSIKDLEKFIEGDPQPIIAFYGGEPLLNPNFIMRVIDCIPNAKYVIQTNGTLISNLSSKYWHKIDSVLISIDGRPSITNHYRGPNVYEKVVKAAKWLKSIGFRGDLIARMAVSEKSDIFLDVKHLIFLNLFDHIHWQMDVVWSNRWKNFDKWSNESYKPGITKLVDMWITEARKGRVLGLAPFLGILKAMIFTGKIEAPPCGAGSSAIAISTDGSIIACPIAVDVKWAYLGNIKECNWREVIDIVKIGKPCTSCTYFNYCGGRCLYAHFEKLWGEEGFKKICEITKYTIKELSKIKNEVIRLIKEKIINISELIYPKYNNTIEIIP